MALSTTSFEQLAVASELLKFSTPTLSIRWSAGYWTQANSWERPRQAHRLATWQASTFLTFQPRPKDPYFLCEGSTMKRYLCRLLALGLLVGVTGPARAQPRYCFTQL